MQIVKRGTLPEPIPKTERSKLPDLVTWEALQVTERSLTFRVLFSDPTLISANEGSIDVLFISLNLAAYKGIDGRFIPDNSQIRRNLPAQMTLETAETYESVGSVVSWIYLLLLGMNGGLNTSFESLDYQAMMDAIEGP